MRLPDWNDAIVRRRAIGAWIALSLLWSCMRAALIWWVFGSHGTNGLEYLIVDLAATVPYAIYSARAAFAWMDKSPTLLRYVVISAACFISPDLYVVASARQVPLAIWVGFGAFVTLMAILAIKFARSK